ncbi:MAG: FAD-dependent oxidoreductase [Anaerolineae bacterium]
MEQNRILILGAGYSGVMAARRLAHKTNRKAAITLVNGSDHFANRIRFHQLAANQTLPQLPITKMLAGSGVAFMQGMVTAIDATAKTVTVQSAGDSRTLAYDYLIYALGSYIDSSRVPGAAEYALSVSTEATTHALRERLPAVAARGGTLVVCGGGLTGIETATEFAEAFPDLHVKLLTQGTLGADLSQRGREYLLRTFERLGIEVVNQARITRLTPQQVEYQGGAVDYDLALWAGAFAVPALARDAGLQVNGRGQVVVDEHLRSVSHPDIYVVGDAADVVEAINTPVRMGCASAYPMGAYAADDLAALLDGQPHRAHDFGYTVRCISLGRRDGLIQMVNADDQPKEQIITGWMGAQIKEMICRYAVWQIQNERLMYYPRRQALPLPFMTPRAAQPQER